MSVKLDSNPKASFLTQLPVNIQTDPEVNLGAAASTVGVNELVSPIFNTLGGLVGAGYGAFLTKEGVVETAKGIQCGDRHGIISGVMHTGLGATFAGAGIASGVEGIVSSISVFKPSIIGPTEPLINTLGKTRDWLGLGLYTMYIGGAVPALVNLHSFRSQFKQMIDWPRACPQNKALESLHFLQNQIGLSADETRELHSLPPEIAKLKLQMKFDQFSRRVGTESAQKVLESLPRLLNGVTSSNVAEIDGLIAEVDRGNFKQIVMQICLLSAGIMGMLASILALAGFGTAVTLGLVIGSSVLYWANSAIGDQAYKLMHPSTDPSLIGYNPRHAFV